MVNKDQSQYLVVDWFQFTILDDVDELHQQSYINQLFKEFFGLDNEFLILEQSGINGYTLNIQYRNIKAYFHPGYLEKGINFLMSGQGCRDFEQFGIEWQELFTRIKSHSFNINRIDLAIDDFTNNYFTVEKIAYYRRKSWIRSKFRTSLNIDKNVIEDNSSLGYTIQFGSKASLCEITFYDKIKERQSAGFEVDQEVKFWTRTELRFRHEYALQIYDHIRVGDNIMNITKGILYDKIQFLQANKKDSNKSRWNVAKWYLDYLDNVERLKLNTKTKESSIIKKKEWMMKQVSSSLVQVSLADMIDLNTNPLWFVQDMFSRGLKLTDKDVDLINEDRRSRGLSLFTRREILDYIQDINDIVLINDKSLD